MLNFYCLCCYRSHGLYCPFKFPAWQNESHIILNTIPSSPAIHANTSVSFSSLFPISFTFPPDSDFQIGFQIKNSTFTSTENGRHIHSIKRSFFFSIEFNWAHLLIASFPLLRCLLACYVVCGRLFYGVLVSNSVFSLHCYTICLAQLLMSNHQQLG